MTQRVARVSIVLALVVALLVPPPLALSCGPDFKGPAFVSLTGPEVPYAEYARGRLELLQPSYWHEPLFIAYRNLSGKPFTQTELAAFAPPAPSPRLAGSTVPGAGDSQNWISTWENERATLLGQKPRDLRISFDSVGVTRAEMRDQRFLSYYNCLSGAFENATHTLKKRAAQFGAQSPIIREWIAAQDEVFDNCSGEMGYPPKAKPAVIPAVARVEDPAVIRADRAYQIAAAYFYAGEFAAAQEAFDEIAKDSSSPYREIAPYLVARVLIREATIRPDEDQYDDALLAQAEAKLKSVLADKESSEFHAAAERLLGFVRIRLHRQERFRELETFLSTPGESKAFGQDLADYLWLLDRPVRTRLVTVPAADGKPAQQGVATDESSRLQAGDMSDWIFTFHESGEAAYQHAVQRWRETKSLSWLVSAISKAPANDKAASELSAAAEKIPVDSPGYITVAFHRLRLLEQTGQSAAARRQLDEFLSQRSATLSFSAKNPFLALRLKLATNLQEFLQFAPRFSNDAAVYPNPPEPGAQPAPVAAAHFDADASVIFTEKLPLRLLADAAKSEALPKALRREVVVAAWTRAILLHDERIARELIPTAQELAPEIKDALNEYATADDASREFAAVWAILRNPGFRPFVTAGYTRGNLYTVGEPAFDRIDNLHDNWWCSLAPASPDQAFGQDYYRMFTSLSVPLQRVYAGAQVSSPAFLTTEQRATAEKEVATLEALPSAPNWLGQRALEWAKAHPDDPRVPEALHHVVSAWRYGCTPGEGVNYSKQAFDLLHSRYTDNEWTKKTPYWFK